MPLPTRPMHVPAGVTIDESTRSELVALGTKNLAAENARIEDRLSLSKRAGFTYRTVTRLDGTTRSAGYRIFSHDKQTCVIDGTSIDAYSSQIPVNVNRGRVPVCSATVTYLPSMGAGTRSVYDVAYCNGYLAIVTLDTYGIGLTAYVNVTIVDAATGAVVSGPETVQSSTTSEKPLLATHDNYIYAVYLESGNSIKAKRLDVSSAVSISAGWSAATTLCTDSSGSVYFGVESLTDRVALAYVNTSGGASQVTVKTFDETGVLETRTVNTGGVTPNAVDVAGSIADTLWVAWNQTTQVYVIGLDADVLATTLSAAGLIATTSAGTTRVLLAASATTGSGCVFAVDSNAVYTERRPFLNSAGTTTATGSAASFDNAVIHGRPFEQGGVYYAHFAPDSITSNPQGIELLCDSASDNYAARPMALPIAAGLADTTGRESSVRTSDTTVRYTVCGVKRNALVSGVALIRYDFADIERWQVARHAGVTFLTGGVASYYDGERVAECGFVHSPRKPTTSTSGTGITLATGRRYVAVYEEVDSSGIWHQSGVSEPSASTGAVANKTITVETTSISLTARYLANTVKQAIRVAFYATLDGGEAPYYRLGVTSPSLSTGDVLTYADSTSDATLATQPLLYGTGNLPATTVVGTTTNIAAQDRRAPPGFSHVVSYNGMLVGSVGSSLWYSGQDVDGEGTWFSPVFQVPVPDTVTALQTQDGTLYAFTRDAIYALSGEPPNDNGTQGGLGLPRRLAADVGAIRGVTCVTSLGIFFMSIRGIELLNRGQSVDFIGQEVQSTFALYPVVTAMTFEPRSTCVYVECAGSETDGLVGDGGRTLVYDTAEKGWVSFDRRRSYNGSADTPAQDGCMAWNGTDWVYTWLEYTGRVRPETPGTSLDVGSSNNFVAMSWVPAEFHLGLLQEQRLFEAELLFERVSAAGLKVEVAHDYDGFVAAEADKTWSEAEVVTAGRIVPFRPKARGTSLRFRITDTAPATLGSGQGITFVGITADMAPKQGATRATPKVSTTLRK